MIEKIGRYAASWQLPFVALFVLAWLYGGGVLLRRRLCKEEGLRRIKLGRCVLGCLYAGSGGALSGLVLFLLVEIAGRRIGLPLTIPAAAVGLAATILVLFMVLLAMFPLPWRRLAGAAILPVAAVAGIGALIAAGVGPVAYVVWQRQHRKNLGLVDLQYVQAAVVQYEARFGGITPPDLTALVDGRIIEAGRVSGNAARPDGARFFYYPAKSLPHDQDTKSMRACDFRPTHKGGRNVLLANGDARWFDEREFQQALGLPENAAFAKALKAADGP